MAAFTNTDNFFNPAYQSPQATEAQRAYAKALLEQSNTPVTGGKGGWAIGLSNLTNALMSGVEARRADVGQQRSRQSDIASVLGAMGGPQPQGPSVIGQSTEAAPSSTGAPGNAIAGIESGGKYDILGPVTRTGDRAYGKYQVMGNNIPEWSQAALGQPMTKEQFLASPEAQDAVFNHRFGQYTNKYGPEGAARAWFAGEGGMNDLGRKDQLGTSVGDYGSRFAAALGAPPQQQPPVQMASLGGGIPPQQPQAQPIPNAGATPPPMPAQQGGLNLPQGHPMGLNMPLIQALMGAQNLDPRMTQGLMSMAAPQMIEGPGGQYARNPITGQTQLIMPKVEKDTMEVGGSKIPLRSVFNQKTGQYDTTPILPGGQQQPQQAGQSNNPFGGAQPFIDQATRNSAAKKGAETTSEELSKAQTVPIGEAIKQGNDSQDVRNSLAILKDAYAKGGPNINGGPLGKSLLAAKQFVNQATGYDVGGLPESEVIDKTNLGLSFKLVKALTSRGTQMEVLGAMKANPGLLTSNKGSTYMIDLLDQQAKQAQELGEIASNVKNPSEWAKAKKEYYASHPLISPFTGKPLIGLEVSKDFDQLKQGDATQPARAASQGGIQEGATATNPQTGAKIIFKGGQWIPRQ